MVLQSSRDVRWSSVRWPTRKCNPIFVNTLIIELVALLQGALYESTHVDENPIATIRHKGTVYQSFDEYVQKTDSGQRRKDTDFYLVGHYNPISGELQRFTDKWKRRRTTTTSPSIAEKHICLCWTSMNSDRSALCSISFAFFALYYYT